MRTKLTESQIEQIILEETLDVLEEGKLDESIFSSFRALRRAYKKAKKASEKAKQAAEKSTRPARKAAEDGRPEGLGTAGDKLDDEGFGLRTFTDLMGKKTATQLILGILKSFWLMITFGPISFVVNQTYEEFVAPFFEGWCNDTSAALRIS